MKRRMLAMAIALICSFATYAQTADAIITKYFENTGGIAKWKALQGIKISAKVNQGGMEIPVTIYQLKDGRQMTVISVQGTEFKQSVYDGTTLWGINFSNMKPEKSDAETTENFKRDLGDFPDPFLNYKARGFKIELVGKDTVDGTTAFKIKLTKKPAKVDGKEVENVMFYFFDAESFVPVMTEAVLKSGPGKGATTQIKMSDYQEVNGLMMPFALSQGAKGGASTPIVVTGIEIDPKVDDAAFIFPAEK
ncbi:MAG: outer membrane lipoprotein-sorting protein [Chryseolinea sp.]